MIEHVQAGQRISASKINSIIDASQSGRLDPDSSFGHEQGVLYGKSDVYGAQANARCELLDVTVGDAVTQRIADKGLQETFVQLGRSLAELKETLCVSYVCTYSSKEKKLIEVTDEMFKPNKDGYYNDGWIATETPAFSSEYYLIVVSGSSECAIFSDVGFNGDLASQVKSKLGEISGHSERVIAFMTTDQLSSSAVVQCKEQPAANAMAPVQWQLTCILDKRYEEVELSSGELSTKTYVTPKIAFWNTDAYGDASKAAVCWNGRKFSSEFTDLSVGWNVLTSLEEVEEGHVPDYDFDAYLYLHAIGPAKPEHAIAEEYLTTATWNVLAKEAAFKIEERCHIGADGKLDDGREVKALYPIGQVKIRNSTPEVKQCMAGACEFLEMGWGRDGGGQGSGGADQKADTEMLSSDVAVQTKSIDRRFYNYEVELSDGTTELCTGSYFLMHDFQAPSEEAIFLSASPSGTPSDDFKTPSRLKVLVRDGAEGEVPELKYASLQIDMPSISTDTGNKTGQQSIQMLDEDSHGFGTLQLFNFESGKADMTVSLSSGVTEKPHFLVRDGTTLKYAKIEMPDLSADESALSDLSSKVFIPDTYFIEDMGGQMAGELLPNVKTIEVNEICGHKVASLYGAYDEGHMTYISSTTQYHNDEWGKNVVLYGYEENDPSTAKIMYVGTNYIDIPTDTDTLSTATFKQKQDEPDMKIGLAGTTEAGRRVADESLSSQSANLEVLLLEGKKTLKYCNLAPLLSGSCETSADISSYQLEAEYPLVKSETSSGKDTSWNISVDGWQSPGNLSSIQFQSRIVNYGSYIEPVSTNGKLLVRKDADTLIYQGIKHYNSTITDNKSIEAVDAGDGYQGYNMLQLKGFQSGYNGNQMLKPQSDSDWKDWLKGGSTITCDTYVNDVAINVTHSAIMRNTQGEDVSLEYLQPPSLVLPALWKADDESIERKNKGEPDAYDQLKGWEKGGSQLTVSIQPGGDVALGSGDFLMRNNGLTYNSITLRCPEMSASQGQVQEIEKTIIKEVKVISADLSSALEEGLKKAWQQGASSEQNYGSSIGNSQQSKVIDLDYQQLNGTWYSDEFHALTCDAQQLVVYNVDVTNMLQFLAMNEDALVWLCSNYTKLKELVENSST